jgi:hypothetical protein
MQRATDHMLTRGKASCRRVHFSPRNTAARASFPNWEVFPGVIDSQLRTGKGFNPCSLNGSTESPRTVQDSDLVFLATIALSRHCIGLCLDKARDMLLEWFYRSNGILLLSSHRSGAGAWIRHRDNPPKRMDGMVDDGQEMRLRG